MIRRQVPPRSQNPEHIDNMLVLNSIINVENNILYININKNASQSMSNWFVGELIDCSMLTTQKEERLNNVARIFDYTNNPQIKKITVIRDPVDRLVSSYYEVKNHVSNGKFDRWVMKDVPKAQEWLHNNGFNSFTQYGEYVASKEKLLHSGDENSSNNFLINPHLMQWMNTEEKLKNLEWCNPKYNDKESFNLLVDSLINYNFYDIHLFPQYVFLMDKGIEDLSTCHYFLFENLSKDIKFYVDYYNLPLSSTLPKINVNKNLEKEELKSIVYNDSALTDKINEIYKIDKELYLYAKNTSTRLTH